METKFNLQLFAEDAAGTDTGEALESAASNTDIADNTTEPHRLMQVNRLKLLNRR